jgi:hypothetical protein
MTAKTEESCGLDRVVRRTGGENKFGEIHCGHSYAFPRTGRFTLTTLTTLTK